MSDVGAFIGALAGSMHLWRDSAVTALVGLVIGCLYLYASLVGEP